jgi:predicted MFS family arabinose efflux permease
LKKYPTHDHPDAFGTTIIGIAVLLPLVDGSAKRDIRPGLLLIGLGVGAMLTPSVNIVQSVSGNQQGEISGLSQCVSNLGSSLGTAVAGTILIAGLDKGAYACHDRPWTPRLRRTHNNASATAAASTANRRSARKL